MTVSNQAIPGDLLSGMRTGDEQALERGFREIYPALIAEAESGLHGQGSPSRVVERAVLDLLSGPPPENLQALEKALDQAMHHAITREQSRQAAVRRFEHNEHVNHGEQRHAAAADAPAVWKRITDARHRAPGPAAHDLKAAQHAAAGHLAGALRGDKRKVSIPLIILGVFALCAVAYGLMQIDPRPSEQFVQAQLAANTARTITTAFGQTGNMSLTDGTEMRIAAGSVVKVVNGFNDPLRAISVKGSAGLTIAAEKSPFEIRANGVAISATDGKVDISAEENRPTIVRVVAGSPLITVGDSSWTAAAGQLYAIDNGIRAPTAGETDQAFAWMEGRFAMTGTIREIVAGIRRWYDVDIGIGDNALADRPASATGSLESINSTLDALKASGKVRVIWENRHMLIFPR